MAGEKVGEAFEILILLALMELGYTKDKDLFWGKKPKGLTIDPDFVLGSLEKPTHWLLVTSSGSAKNSLEKFWRNLGELFDVKRTYSKPPKVVNLVLESNLRRALQRAMTAVADSEIVFGEEEFGETLLKFINRISKRLTKDKEKNIKLVAVSLRRSSSSSKSFQALIKKLRTVLKRSKTEFRHLWKILSSEKRLRDDFSARQTYVRRGMAKLMTLSSEERITCSSRK